MIKNAGWLVVVVVAPSVLAATSADLDVTGFVLPPSCDIAMAIPTIDFTAITLNNTGRTTLAESAGHALTIACAGSTMVGFRGQDNMAATALDTSFSKYGLGTDALGNKIGYYVINLTAGIADGAPGRLKYSLNDGATWTLITTYPYMGNLNQYALQNSTYSLSSSQTAGQPPAPIMNASMDVSVIPTIAPRNALDTTGDIQLNGSATIELIYL